MLEEGTVSLRDAIVTEIDQSYRMIDIAGKHYSSILLGFISLISIVGLSTVKNLFSDWIFASNLFIVGISVISVLNSIVTLSKKSNTQYKSSPLSEEQKVVNSLISCDAALKYFDSIAKSIAAIISVNLVIILLCLSDVLSGDYTILKDNISILSLSIPTLWWFALQACSLLIVTWFFTSKGDMMRSALRDMILLLIPSSMSSKFQRFKIPIFSGGIFIISIFFIFFSLIFTIVKLQALVSNWIIVWIIFVVQIGIFALINDYFSANEVKIYYFYKVYQLNVALTIVENTLHSPDGNSSEEAEYIYHVSRFFSPVKMNWWIFFSNYLLIPNVAYMTENYQDTVTRYLITIF